MNGKKIKINRATRYVINDTKKNDLVDGKLQTLQFIDASSTGICLTAQDNQQLNTALGSFLTVAIISEEQPITLALELVRCFNKQGVQHFCFRISNADQKQWLRFCDWIARFGTIIEEHFVDSQRSERISITAGDYLSVHEVNQTTSEKAASLQPRIVNLSNEGMCFKTRTLYKTGDVISLKICLHHSICITFCATVRWIKADTFQRFYVGLEYKDDFSHNDLYLSWMHDCNLAAA